MEFRLGLLQNEIEHLNKNMGLMSEELIVLKEFIRQEFATSFEAFNNARKDKHRHHHHKIAAEPSSSHHKQPAFPEIIKNEPALDAYYDENDAELDNIDEDVVVEVIAILNVSKLIYLIPIYPINESFCPDVDPLQTSPNNSPIRKGKPKAQIHKYFEHISMPDGKVRTKCFTCQEYVSNQAQRLKKHFERCSGKLNMDSKVIKRITTIGYKRPSGSSENPTKVGRKLDRVRELFEELHDKSGFIKMKCLSCGHLSSNQASRMKKHVEKCEGLANIDQHRIFTPSENHKAYIKPSTVPSSSSNMQLSQTIEPSPPLASHENATVAVNSNHLNSSSTSESYYKGEEISQVITPSPSHPSQYQMDNNLEL
ncbi:hypothetical protein Fcan01_28635 [Folsomia candida]|uniref:BED-type domain-containing protein n=1 Tax=Folsomia candida TaxID=158441 RepID=A0A226CX40_FOLCA|nr:hypothetical protein Fcan01_28635 [Folsomia candida]